MYPNTQSSGSSGVGRRAGLRRSVSTRILGKSNNGNSSCDKSTLESQALAPKQQLQTVFDEDSNIDNINNTTAAAAATVGKDGGTLLGRLHQVGRKGSIMDLMGTQSSSGARFVKRSAVFPNDNASRYNSTGYPKSTRSIRSSDGTTGEMRPVSTHMSMDRPPSTYERPTSQSQTKLKGFQVRVINTHVGRTLVHAPILENSATETMQEDGPELPPLSAAELRYNAQRALINTTAVLRTAVGSKHANKGGGSKQPQQLLSAEVVNAHATYSSSSSSGKAKEKDMGKRQGSHRVSDKGYVTPPTSAIGGSSDYNDSSTGRTGTLLAEQSPKPGFTELNLGFTPELGQSPPMSGASVLDQWGISTAAQFGQQKHALQLEAARQERLLRGDDYGDDVDADQASDADSVTENAAWIVEQMASGCTPTLETMFPRGPPRSENNGRLGHTPNESQQLIDSIFGGRLSINNTQDGTTSKWDQSVDMSPSHGLSRKESTIKSKLKLGSGWTQTQSPQPQPQPKLSQDQQQYNQQQYQLHQQQIQQSFMSDLADERDANKMRKPSFWSIFRGPSHRKDHDDKKEAPGHTEAASQASNNTRQHLLKKQQSSPSGFSDNFGFTKLLASADNKYNSASSASTFSHKALPSLPPVSPPLPPPPASQPRKSAQIQLILSEEDNANNPQSNSQMLAANSRADNSLSIMRAEEAAAAAAVSAGAFNESSSSNPVVPKIMVNRNSVLSILSNGDGANGGFYTPMQEMFPLSLSEAASTDMPQSGSSGVPNSQSEDAALYQPHLVQGADSLSAARTPAESPVLNAGGASALVSAVSVGELLSDDDDDDDGDSDIAPLSQSRVFFDAHTRNSLNAQQQQKLAASIEGDGANGLGILNGASPALAGSLAKAHPMAAHINLMEMPTVNSDIPDAAAGEVDDQCQPLIIKKNQHLQQRQQATPSSSVTSAALEDGSMNQDSSVQARAMGKYLYDIEEYQCQFYSQANHKANERPIEPPKPEVLQGFVIPFLVDHAEWLGKREVFNGLALQYYITNYDFSGMRIDECLRKLCSHIFLRGESQVIDRLLVALSQRYAECNPDTRLRTADVAHAVTYSTLLLNTDLHIADIRSSDRMTKSRFVRNTVDTIAQFQQSNVVAPAVQRPVVADDTLEDVDGGLSLPPQLPELDLAKQSIESAQATGADTPMSTSSRLLPGADSFDIGDSLSGPVGASEQQSTLRSLVGSMTSLNMSGSNNGGAGGAGGASGNGTTGSRTSRDVVRLMGGRGKRFSFFDTSSAGGNPLAGPAAAAAASAAASLNSSSGTLSGSQTPNIGVGSSGTQLGAGQSSSRAFDRLRRKVSTNGTHVRTRSGTLSMDESPQPLNGRTSLSGSQHSHQQREGETLGSMVGRALSAAAGVTGSNNSGAGGSDSARARDAAAAVNSNMPNLTELSSVLKDVYSGIKSKPLGQPPFARQASILYEQHQQQQQQMQNNAHYSMGHVLSRNSHDHMLNGNMRSSQAFGHGAGKQSMDVDANGRPSSVRSMPMHSVQRTRSITSMNKAAAGGQGAGAMRRTPHHHADMRGVGFVPEAMKRSGSSMINFGTNGSNAGANTVRSSPSAGSMGTGYTASTSFTTYLRSPIENQHIRSGVLVRKHLFERSGKKASHRAWRTCYVSVDRGTVAMYKMDGRHGAHPDGRELTDTSLQLGSVSLRHTMTHMLPSPGYSRSRPHVFALQLPSGGVYLFQTASEVELRDWVVACNYWAARESKAPYMIGGVYNMEYGWDNTGDFTLRFDEREAREDRGETLSATEQAAEQRRIMEEREASKGASILEWTPPNNPMQRSDQEEAGQLKALLHHISYLEDELVSHKKIQGSIEERFAPKTQIFHRAFGNWERKAQYILQELIKYQSYADVLQKTLKQMQDELTLPIPEEGAAPGADGSAGFGAIFHGHGSSGAVGGGGSDEPSGDTIVAQQQAAGRLSSATSVTPLSGSRTSLPQTNSRRTNDANGNPAGSKSLPIKELLASASDKARNRASIIVPNSASSATTTASSSLGMDKRRGSQPHVAAHRQSSGSTVSSPLPDNHVAAV